MKLTDGQWQALRGLNPGHKYMSASEAGDPEILELFNLELVHRWSTIGCFSAWGLTPAGRAALEAEDG